MTSYGPSPQQAKQIAESVGCRVIVDQPVHDGTVATHIDCETHENKVRLLAALAEFDSRDPKQVAQLRRVADLEGGRPGASDRERAALLLEWFQRNVSHATETVETFAPAWRTIEAGVGDCDDHARALVALYRVAGFDAAMGTLGSPPTHVAAVVKVDGDWNWAESTVPGAALGEHPQAAVLRTRAGGRADVSGQLGDATTPRPNQRASDAVALAQLTGAALFIRDGNKAGALLAAAGVAAQTYLWIDAIAKCTESGAKKCGDDSLSLLDVADFVVAPMALYKAGAPALAFPAVAAAQYAARKSRFGAVGMWTVTLGVVAGAALAD